MTSTSPSATARPGTILTRRAESSSLAAVLGPTQATGGNATASHPIRAVSSSTAVARALAPLGDATTIWSWLPEASAAVSAAPPSTGGTISIVATPTVEAPSASSFSVRADACALARVTTTVTPASGAWSATMRPRDESAARRQGAFRVQAHRPLSP